MEPLIYKIYVSDTEKISLKTNDIIYDATPPPKLIKYGYNKEVEISNSFLLNQNNNNIALLFTFNLCSDTKSSFKINSKIDCRLFSCTWEIIMMFIESSNKKLSFYSSHPEILSAVSDNMTSLVKSKTKLELESKKDVDLVFWICSPIQIEESAYVHLLLKELQILLKKHSTGSSMVLQLFSVNTQIMADIIYLLSTMYKESYMVRPSSVADTDDIRYLVLMGFKSDNGFSNLKINIPNIGSNKYITNILFDHEKIPDIFCSTIQCMNSKIIPSILTIRNKIKKYIERGIFDGAIKDELTSNQENNISKWEELFTNRDNISKTLMKNIDSSKNECDHAAELNVLFNIS